MPRRPKVWFDYEYLTSLDAESAPREVFFLSEPAQQVLSQLAEIVLWPTRWFNGDPGDSAVLAASIYEELKVPAHFDDLIPLLDDVETLLQELIDKELCCDTIDTVPGGDEINGVDESTLPPDVDRDGESLPPEYEGDPTAYDAYLCGQAQRLSETTDNAVDAVHDTIFAASNVIVFATLVILAFGNVIGMGIAAILAGGYTLVTISEIVGYYSAFTELRELLGGGDPGGLVAQTKSEMDGVADALENAVFCANDAGEAYTAIASLIDSVVTSGSYAALLKLTYAISLRPIFWGFGGAPDSGDCNCEAFYSRLWDFQVSLEGWSGEVSLSVNDYMNLGSGAANYANMNSSTVKSDKGFGSGISLLPTSVVMDFYITHDAGIQWQIGGLLRSFTGGSYALDTWHTDVEVDLTGVDPVDLDTETYLCRIRNLRTTVGSGARLDNIRVTAESA